MTRRFCGIDMGRFLEGMRPLDEVRSVAIHALEEILRGELPYRALRDDGAPPARFCLLILGRIGSDFHLATIDGPKPRRGKTSDMSDSIIKAAIAAIPDGRSGKGQLERVIASPYGTAGALIVAESSTGTMNCGFARNPALDPADAARLLKAYFTCAISSWTGKN